MRRICRCFLFHVHLALTLRYRGIGLVVEVFVDEHSQIFTFRIYQPIAHVWNPAVLLPNSHPICIGQKCSGVPKPCSRYRLYLSIEQGRSGHGVSATQVRVDVELDAGVGVLVEGRGRDTRWLGAAATSDLNVDALGVVLGTIEVAGGVKTDDLVAEDVVSAGNGSRDGDDGGVVVGDQLVSGPLARRRAAVDETLGFDLEELQRGLVRLGAVAVARGEVVEDGAVVALRPGVPLHLDLRAGGHGGSQGAGSTALMAGNVDSVITSTVDEAEVGGGGGPANGLGRVVHVGVLVDEVTRVAVVLSASLVHVCGPYSRLTICHRQRFQRRNRGPPRGWPRQECP